jgi:hypothetical protein
MFKRINHFLFLTIFATAFVIGCTPNNGDKNGGAPQNGETDLSRTQKTEGGTWEVSYTPDPDPFMSQMDFSLLVTVKRVDGESLAADLTVVADAWMPEHGHGMLPEVNPTTTALSDEGAFRVDGMNLLMGGLWEIYIDVQAGEKEERATFNVQVEGGGDHSMLDGGHMHMGDGGHMDHEDGGMMHMGDGGHMHHEDGGMMHMDAG